MKKFAKLFLTLLLLGISCAYSMNITNWPVTFKQPDGRTINCFVSGDEFYNWAHDAGNYTIVQNKQTGYYCYATKQNDELLPSQFIVGDINPEITGLEKNINISPEKMLSIRNAGLMSATKHFKGFKGGKKAFGIDTINNLVIYIRFSDEAEFTEDTTFYANMFNNVPGNSSMKNYFLEASYNKMYINSTFYPHSPTSTVVSYKDNHPRGYYMPYNASTNPIGYQGSDEWDREDSLVAKAVIAVRSQIPANLNLDYNGDGFIDNVCFIVDGNTTAWSTLLWPHRTSYYGDPILINSKQFSDYNLQVQNHLSFYTVGVLSHEMFHTLGSPDLYHYMNQGVLTPVGQWDIMESNTNPPQHMGAYMKFKYGGWISSIPTISTPGTYTLNPVTSATGNSYKIASPYSVDEFFIVEYRRKTGVFENSLPGTGLLVYRINTNYTGNAGFDPTNNIYDEVYAYRPYGSTDINGQTANANFSLNLGRTKINDITNPSSFLTDGSNGGLPISNITASGTTISFDLYGGAAVSNDAAVELVVNPVSSCSLGSTEVISVLVKNYGQNAINSGLSLSYKINANSVVTEPYTGATIQPGQTVNYSFLQTANLSAAGNYVVKTYATLTGDTKHNNDTLTVNVSKSSLAYQAVDISNNTGTYTDLDANGTVINTANSDNANSVAVNIEFTFYYNCSSFTQFVLNTNGFIKLGNTAPSTASLFFASATTSDAGVFNSNNAADMNLIIPFSHDLNAGTSIPEYRVYTSGISPNKVCTIQFKNVRDKTTSPAQQFNNMNFQIKLYETSNKIDFVYGDWQSSANGSSFKTSGLGLKGSGNGYGQLITGRKSSVIDWSSIIFESLNYNGTATLNFGNPPDRPKPDFGRTISFIANTNTPTVVTNAATSVTSATAVLNGSINGLGIYTNSFFEYGTTTSYGNVVIGNPYNIYNSASTAISLGISGLLPNTTYHYRIKAVNSNGIAYGNDRTFSTATVGVENFEYQQLNVEIYPNPNNGVFTISLKNALIEKANLVIYNYTGQQVSLSEVHFTSINVTVDLNNLPAGLYYIELVSNNMRYTGKMIIN
jgi:M6 family metalloprotease-like protein